MTGQMRAAVFRGPGEIHLETKPIPASSTTPRSSALRPGFNAANRFPRECVNRWSGLGRIQSGKPAGPIWMP